LAQTIILLHSSYIYRRAHRRRKYLYSQTGETLQSYQEVARNLAEDTEEAGDSDGVDADEGFAELQDKMPNPTTGTALRKKLDVKNPKSLYNSKFVCHAITSFVKRSYSVT
jgi:hypothetical protein